MHGCLKELINKNIYIGIYINKNGGVPQGISVFVCLYQSLMMESAACDEAMRLCGRLFQGLAVADGHGQILQALCCRLHARLTVGRKSICLESEWMAYVAVPFSGALKYDSMSYS